MEPGTQGAADMRPRHHMLFLPRPATGIPLVPHKPLSVSLGGEGQLHDAGVSANISYQKSLPLGVLVGSSVSVHFFIRDQKSPLARQTSST